MSEGFTISGIDHVGLTARDMDASIHFYRDLLGLRLLHDLRMDQDPTRPGGLYHGRRTRRRLVLFESGGGPNIAINGHPGDDLPGEPILLDGVGVNHVSLVVSDLAALTHKLTEAGIESPGPGWFLDPDGTLVQFEEPGHAEAGLARLAANADG